MFEVIIVTHGTLAAALLQTAQLIVGEKSGVQTFGFELGDSIDKLADDVENAVSAALEKGDVLVITDLKSGSPFNVTVRSMCNHQFRHITGVNLSMLIEVLGSREFMSLEETVESAMEAGKEAVLDINKYLEELE